MKAASSVLLFQRIPPKPAKSAPSFLHILQSRSHHQIRLCQQRQISMEHLGITRMLCPTIGGLVWIRWVYRLYYKWAFNGLRMVAILDSSVSPVSKICGKMLIGRRQEQLPRPPPRILSPTPYSDECPTRRRHHPSTRLVRARDLRPRELLSHKRLHTDPLPRRLLLSSRLL